MNKCVRQIVSEIGIDVVTKKMVYKKYSKLQGLSVLSSATKTEIRAILDHIIEELAANPGASIICDEDVELETGSKDVTDEKAVERESSCADEDTEQRDVESVKSFDNADDEQKDTSLSLSDKESVELQVDSKVKDRRENQSDAELNSDEETIKDVNKITRRSSPRKGRLRSPIADEAEEESVTSQNSKLNRPKPSRLKRLKSKDVLNSILDSDNNIGASSEAGDFSSPAVTPKKQKPRSNMNEESPLVKSKRFTKKRKITCFVSDSESDFSEEEKSNVRKSVLSPSASNHSADGPNSSDLEDSSHTLAREDSSDLDTENREIRGDKTLVSESKSGVDGSISIKNSCKSKKSRAVLKECIVRLTDCSGKIDKGSKNSINKNKVKPLTAKVTIPVHDHVIENKRKRSSSSSSLNSDISDAESSHQNTTKAVPAKKHNSEKHVKEKHQKSASQAENKNLKNLRIICRSVGMILRNTIELKGCDTDQEKIIRIKQLLREKGMKGRPSMKKVKQINLERELKALKNSDSESDMETETPSKPPRKRRCRSDCSPVKKSQPAVNHQNDFSRIKDICCADDSSD